MRNIDYWARSRNKKKLGVLYTKNTTTRTINEIHNLRNNKKIFMKLGPKIKDLRQGFRA